jgi:hypothetical protein
MSAIPSLPPSGSTYEWIPEIDRVVQNVGRYRFTVLVPGSWDAATTQAFLTTRGWDVSSIGAPPADVAAVLAGIAVQGLPSPAGWWVMGTWVGPDATTLPKTDGLLTYATLDVQTVVPPGDVPMGAPPPAPSKLPAVLAFLGGGVLVASLIAMTRRGHEVVRHAAMANPREIVAKRTTYDGVAVLFWSDGAVTDRVGRLVKGRLPTDRIFEFANEVAIYGWNEIPDAIARFKRGEVVGTRRPARAPDVPESKRLYREITSAAGLKHTIRIKENPSIFAPQRLTPDITIRGYMPTKRQYDASLRILRDIASKGRVSGGYAASIDPSEHDVWIALHQQGLLRNTLSRDYGRGNLQAPFRWNEIELSDYGRKYLEQRTS